MGQALTEKIKNSRSTLKSPDRAVEGCRDIEIDSENLWKLDAAGLKRSLVASLKSVEQDFGLLSAGSTSSHGFRDDQFLCLKTLTGQAVIALQRWRLDWERAARGAALKKAHRELEIRV